MAKEFAEQQQVVTSVKNKMGISNRLVGCLNILSLLFSCVLMGGGIWLATRHGPACVRDLMWPLLVIGIFLFVFSLLGVIGACLRIRILLLLYLAVTLIVIIVLLGITIFAFAVTSKGSGVAVPGRQYQEYQLNRYSNWLQNVVSQQSNWGSIKTCIQSTKDCQQLNYPDEASFNDANLSPLQSGCCKPPTACNFTFVNATDWITNTASDQITDCSTWSNNASELCYDCDSCRAGAAEDVRRDWSKMAILCTVMIVFMLVVYALGCCAASNPKNRFYEKQVVKNSASGKRRSVIHKATSQY